MPALDTPGAMARRIRTLLRVRNRIQTELPTLAAEEQNDRKLQRRGDDTRRKLLTGAAVLHWVYQHPRLIRFLRMALDAGLTRTRDRQFFNLRNNGPLIPAEDWPGWPDGRPADETLAEVPRAGMSPRQRRVRIAYLAKRDAAIRAQLDDLAAKYAPHRDAKNKQRQILVGAVMLTLSFGNEGITRRLRKLLNLRYTEAKERKLFMLEGDGPLVPQQDQAGLRPTRRQAPKVQGSKARSSAAAGGVRRPRSASAGANGSNGGGASEPKDPGHARSDPAPNVQEPMPDWKPYKLRVENPSGPRRLKWGAQLRGHAAVQALPMELVGCEIAVTDSNLHTWKTRVTEVVSRDDACVIVRNSGRPRSAGERPG